MHIAKLHHGRCAENPKHRTQSGSLASSHDSTQSRGGRCQALERAVQAIDAIRHQATPVPEAYPSAHWARPALLSTTGEGPRPVWTLARVLLS